MAVRCLLHKDWCAADLPIRSRKLYNTRYKIKAERLHPHVWAWKERLAARPEFAKEIAPLRDTAAQIEARHRAQAAAGKTLEAVAGF
ncbi:MAG TPA: hypothetical protein VHU22_25080 [Xanthobacteraceae bacterium]|jgi:hypothetical protein|nr:hypothetical protein [Xanthobacteraceae bacterium]